MSERIEVYISNIANPKIIVSPGKSLLTQIINVASRYL